MAAATSALYMYGPVGCAAFYLTYMTCILLRPALRTAVPGNSDTAAAAAGGVAAAAAEQQG